MENQNVKATLAALIEKVGKLQAENEDLRTKNAACAQAMTKLVTRVEHLQAQVQEHKPGNNLTESDYRTGGPARYVRVEETGGRLGFITPLSHNFCESCNRVRLTCTGTLYMCLGQEDAADLRAPLRASPDDALLEDAIGAAIARKPKGHDFIIDRRHRGPAVPRHMSVTGG